jgi:hypothetical protein
MPVLCIPKFNRVKCLFCFVRMNSKLLIHLSFFLIDPLHSTNTRYSCTAEGATNDVIDIHVFQQHPVYGPITLRRKDCQVL